MHKLPALKNLNNKVYPMFLPFLFGIFPVLATYSHNQAELTLSALYLPVALSLGLIVIVLVISQILFRDVYRATVFSIVFLVIFFSYGNITPYLRFRIVFHNIIIGPNKVFIPLVVIFIFFMVYGLLKTSRSMEPLLGFLKIIGMAIVVIPLVSIIIGEFTTPRNYPDPRIDISKQLEATAGNKSNDIGYQPDIYYIIFDRYANQHTLDEYLGFDNKPTLDFLRERGFYIADKSTGNYNATHLSLASSLNMQYLDMLKDIDDNNHYQHITYNLIQDNNVGRFLKAKGYNVICIGSWFEPTRSSKVADIMYNAHPLFINEFTETLYSTTLAYPFFFKNNLGYEKYRSLSTYQFDKLEQIAGSSSPKFVFAHIILPHQPYVFDAKGGALNLTEIIDKERPSLYLDQLQYANIKIRETVGAIMKNSEHAPIIILQSDEGPSAGKDGDLGVAFKIDKENDIFRIHQRIFNAYYLPGSSKNQLLYDSITPVNTFRTIFNQYFGTDFKILDDRNYEGIKIDITNKFW